MSKQTVQEVIDEIKSSIRTSSTGNPVKSFSRTSFDKLAKAIINDPDYSYEVYAIRGGKVDKKTVKPVELWRATLRTLLQDFGVDKHESAKVMEASTEFKSVAGFYELASAIIYEYIDAGKSFAFPTREDFTGSITLREVDESVVEYKDIRDPEKKFKVKQQKHKRLEKKSKTAKWLKTRL